MSGKVCRETRREIDQSELRQALSAEAEAHAATCAECARFRDERFRLRELVGALEPVVAPADFDVRLRARIARERDSHKQPSIFRFFMSTPAIAVTAMLVMVVGTIVYLSQRDRTVNSTVASVGQEKPAAATNGAVPAPAVNADDTAPIHTVAGSYGPESLRHSNPGTRTVAKNGTTVTMGPQVNDLAVSPAESYRLAPDRAGEVSLTAPVKPMVVTMYDERGGSRKIQLPPISFGSQRLTDNRAPVSMTNTRDW